MTTTRVNEFWLLPVEEFRQRTDRRTVFLDALRETGQVARAAEQAGRDARTFWTLAKEDPAFGQEMEQARKAAALAGRKVRRRG